MRGNREKRAEKGASLQADFLSRALEVLDPEIMAKTMEENPDFVLGMLESI